MSEIILHHYGLSAYAAKARMILNFKGIPWRSVEVPMIMPKPELVALTGGWRMVPVLQIGADIYLDSKAVAERLEALKPEPTLHPSGQSASEWGLSAWIETIFLDVVTVSFCDGMLPHAFITDRHSVMADKFFDLDTARARVPSALDRIRAVCLRVEQQLADGRPFLLGGRPSLADFSAWVPLGPAPTVPGALPAFAGCTRLLDWHGRMAPYDQGKGEPMTGAEAVAIAREATPATHPGITPDDPNGYRLGDRIRFHHAAYCWETIEGELVHADSWSMAIRRHDKRAGEVVVHFPREGMSVAKL